MTPPVWSDGSAVVAWARACRAAGGTQLDLLGEILAHVPELRAGGGVPLVSAELFALCRSPTVDETRRAVTVALGASPADLSAAMATAAREMECADVARQKARTNRRAHERPEEVAAPTTEAPTIVTAAVPPERSGYDGRQARRAAREPVAAALAAALAAVRATGHGASCISGYKMWAEDYCAGRPAARSRDAIEYAVRRAGDLGHDLARWGDRDGSLRAEAAALAAHAAHAAETAALPGWKKYAEDWSDEAIRRAAAAEEWVARSGRGPERWLNAVSRRILTTGYQLW